MSSIIIVGAGLAGLSAACYLSRTGHDVTVVESRPDVGGLAAERVDQGYRFDLGPTVLTMPSLIQDALEAAGGSLDLMPMSKLDPAYRAFFADGSHLDIWTEHEAMREEVSSNCGADDAAAFDEFTQWLEKLYHLEMPHFIDRNFDSPLTLVSRPRPAAELVAMGGFGKLGNLVKNRFRDTRLQRMYSFQALYAGVSPQEALSIYAVISYMDAVNGVYFPDDGMAALPRAMAQAARDAGVNIVLNTKVTGLPRDSSGRVTGVIYDDRYLAADAVVCTADISTVYDTLLEGARKPLALMKPRYSPSAVVWHVGTADQPTSDIRHHNIHFGDKWDQSFVELMGDRTLMSDPSRLVTVPTQTQPGRAPNGGSVMYVLEPVPELSSGHDWSVMRDSMRDRLLDFLKNNGYPTDIVTEHLVTPAEWKEQELANGTPFSLAHLFRQTGPFRPSNAPRSIPGLFFAGAGTTPGVGVPMVLISGKLAAEQTLKWLGSR